MKDRYKQLLGNIGLFALNVFATKVVAFLLVPLYTYFLNAEDFGIQDMALLVVSILSPVATLCVADGVLRFMIDDSKRAHGYAVAGLLVTSIGCIAVLLCLPFTDLSIFGGLGRYKWLFLIYYASISFQNLLSMVARAVNRLKAILHASIVSSLVTAITAGLLIAVMKLGLSGFFYSSIAGGVSACLIYLFPGNLRKVFIIRDGRDILCCVKRILPYSVPLIPNSILWLLNNSVNRFFITAMMGIGASGMFAAASKIPNLLMMAYSIFQQAWTLSAFQEYRSAGLNVFYSKVYKLLDSMLCITASAIILFSEPLARLFLQKEFYSSWPLIPILIIGLYFNILGSFWGTVYTTFMKTKQILITTLLAATTSVLLTWLTIPRMGLAGAAISLVLSNFVLWISRVVNSRRLLTISVNWGLQLVVYGLLGSQVVLTFFHSNHYFCYSTLLFLACCVLEFVSARQIFSILFRLIRGHFSK